MTTPRPLTLRWTISSLVSVSLLDRLNKGEIRMATTGKKKRDKGGEEEVCVSVPAGTHVKTEPLQKLGKKLSTKELAALIKKASEAKVGFVILNAPFKVRSAEPVS